MKYNIWINILLVITVSISFTGCLADDDEENEVDASKAIYYKPSKSICENSGGIYNDQDMQECKASLPIAKTICEMPTDTQWEKIVLECGYNEKEQTQYLECIENSGYQWAGSNYWSSSLYSDPSYQETLGNSMNIYSGKIDAIGVDFKLFVRCTSGGLEN